ncbi:hypothetical protein LCGC14_0365900 [marine sediment metagenome]|uniref:SF4 helicase domain-containing protein n=1 Tax=marine sediment metagenome TaxID=412755 RepID=A0A0F9WF84_9ZZZZ
MLLEDVLGNLNKVKKQSDGSYLSLCPAHPDRNPSLHITLKEDRLLLHCLSGCQTEAVCQAIGITMTDLFIDDKPAPSSSAKKIVAEYNYTDEAGAFLFQVVRFDPKGFSQRHKNGKNEWVWDMKDVRRVPYHLPEILEEPDTIYFVEGEKDCDTLWGWGQVATTCPGGASAWKPEYAGYFKGKRVVLIPDNDAPGYEYAYQVSSALKEQAREVKVVILPVKDITEWLDAGNDIAELPGMEQDIEALPTPRDGNYAQAHKAITDLLPLLVGETLTREQWYRQIGANPFDPKQADYRHAINKVLLNLSKTNKKKQIVKAGSGFKVIDDSVETIDLLGEAGTAINLILPFGIHTYCKVFAGNIVIVFGSKDAGKTAFILNAIKMNRNNGRAITYYSSEMGRDELRNRLLQDKELTLEQWAGIFQPVIRSSNFDEVLDPDGFNFIDFLELGGDENEYYKGVALIRRIYDRLAGGKGIAVIACHKNQGAALPKGGSGMLEKARIAVSLDKGEAKLVVAKNWVDGIITSPTGKNWTYKLVGGINYFNIVEGSE